MIHAHMKLQGIGTLQGKSGGKLLGVTTVHFLMLVKISVKMIIKNNNEDIDNGTSKINNDNSNDKNSNNDNGNSKESKHNVSVKPYLLIAYELDFMYCFFDAIAWTNYFDDITR